MTTTVQSSTNPLAAAGVATTTTTANQMLNQDDFMKLMIAQMKNQDPTKPLDGQQYLGQLAQFSTLNSIQDLQKSFDSLAQSLRSVQTTQATSLVGREVLVSGNLGYYSAGQPIQGEITLPASVSNLTVKVYNSAGQLVDTVDMGPQSAGQVAFGWNGSGTSGPDIYRIDAQASINGQNQQLATQIWEQVQSVSISQDSGASSLSLVSGGSADMSSIYQIR